MLVAYSSHKLLMVPCERFAVQFGSLMNHRLGCLWATINAFGASSFSVYAWFLPSGYARLRAASCRAIARSWSGVVNVAKVGR